MRKTIISIMVVAMLAMSSVAALAAPRNPAETQRSNACAAIDTGPNVVWSYDGGANANTHNDDVCTVNSTATTYKESTEQVNNPRAAKAVTRTVITAETVTTTQVYRWQPGSDGGSWVANGDPVTEKESAFIEECKTTPGKDHCEGIS
jgi:hypothetical protein